MRHENVVLFDKAGQGMKASTMLSAGSGQRGGRTEMEIGEKKRVRTASGKNSYNYAF